MIKNHKNKTSKNGLAAKEKIYNTKDIIMILSKTLKELKKKGKYRYRKFTFEELNFLVQLIFKRPKNLLFIYMADYLRGNTDFKHIPFNGFNIRRLNFFYNILSLHNAKEAAIAAGYSPISAKQTGYRIVKTIQGYKRIGNSSNFIKLE